MISGQSAQRGATGFTVAETFEVTPSLDTSAYAAGDVLAATTLLGAVMPDPGRSRVWYSVEVMDADDQKQPMDIYILRSNVSVGTRNGALAPSDSANIEMFGPVKITAADYTDVGGASRAVIGNIGLIVSALADSRNLYYAIETNGTPTHAAAGLTLRFGFL